MNSVDTNENARASFDCVDEGWGISFMQNWLNTWNNRTLPLIRELYSKDIELQVCEVSKGSLGVNLLNGIIAAEKYWDLLFFTKPNLQFNIINYGIGFGKITVFYEDQARGLVTEELYFNEKGRIKKSVSYL